MFFVTPLPPFLALFLRILVQPFRNVCDLVPLAESVTKLSAICQVCQAEAAFSKRLSAETAVEVIGGAESYIPTCRRCFFDEAASMSLLSTSMASSGSGGASGSASDDDADTYGEGEGEGEAVQAAIRALDVDGE